MPVTAQLNVTPDGFCDHDDVVIDDDFMRFAIACLDEAQRLVLGRKSYELFVSHWPKAAHDKTLPEMEQKLGQAIDGIDRTLVSRSLETSDWTGTTILPELDRAAAEKLRSQGDILILGSPSVIDQFAQWRLLDRLLLSVHPTMGGNGKRLFDGRIPSEMKFVRGFETGADVRTFEFSL
ncbi:dihydrofolate reductase family protein [Qipengyuania qiaonensis]|uniref:Dihydrofolate reductase family protein n=1 Tax=Qipengyuania qiaonensis TaxID=2867240 RepID=A0ABS7J475_9SPHN|nr:dihydrofolate reductase family protein [Qipengyuania qiaonensis]MBX7482135.1 dihydrofolate reductase family protein [Qipengyuania qiaonensis]